MESGGSKENNNNNNNNNNDNNNNNNNNNNKRNTGRNKLIRYLVLSFYGRYLPLPICCINL